MEKNNENFPAVHISCCEHCWLWEQSKYKVVGTCRRYPHPQTYKWHKCIFWSYKNKSNWYDDLIS
jgi:hypothetical protein